MICILKNSFCSFTGFKHFLFEGSLDVENKKNNFWTLSHFGKINIKSFWGSGAKREFSLSFD